MKAIEPKQNWKILIFVRCKSRDHEEIFFEVLSSMHLAVIEDLSGQNFGLDQLTI